MALPVGPTPPSEDIAVKGWSAITVRIAWTLLATGLKARSRLLRDVRTHVLLHLSPQTQLCDAEDLAEMWTRQFVRRARGENPIGPHDQDNRLPVSPRWRRNLERAATSLSKHVFQMHYGDNRPLKELVQRLNVDRADLETACAGMREVIRRQALTDDVPMLNWSPERLDLLLVRLAAWSPGPCPPAIELSDGDHHQSHTRSCPRCDRTRRLLRNGILTPEDLIPPSLGVRPKETIQVMALQFHPDALAHRRAIKDELAVPCFAVGRDLLLMDASDMASIREVLTLATELNRPHRDHLRGAVIEGVGRFSTYGVLGPLADQADTQVGFRPWGSVDRLAELPEPLPEPPSPRPAWASVAALGAIALGVWSSAFSAQPGHAAWPLEVDFTNARGGIWAEFDVDDAAMVHIVEWKDGAFEVVLHSTSNADKGDLAVGDGSFRTFTDADGILLISTPGKVPLEALITRAEETDPTLESLAQMIRDAEPSADVRYPDP